MLLKYCENQFSVILLAISILLILCSDNVGLKASDVLKCPWLKPFVLDEDNLSRYHNIDLGTMSFKYEYNGAYEEIKGKINGVIIEHNWTVLSRNEMSWEIKKQLEVYDGQYELTYIEIDSLNG